MELNEDFTNLYKRWRGGELRKEDKKYELVDLGLPSGTLWMDRNIGADTPYNDGGYYAWGETEEKEVYSWKTYKFGNFNDLTKYNKEDGKTELKHEDDVVYLKTKGKCHMPTRKQIEELINKTDNKWVEDYNGSGVNGRLFTGSNGNTLFIPAAGYQDVISVNGRGEFIYLWSASLFDRYNQNAFMLLYSKTNNVIIRNIDERYSGFSVRGVLK